MNGTEFYEIKIKNNLTMLEFIDPSNSNNFFVVPKKGVNGRLDGITDDSGDENFYITLTKNNVKVQQTIISLT